ncbi:MAG TPA: PAS domain S-box protein, partial [Thermodesulfovibrionales bacterium]|nr:PAS domain S-box protein [Thermodesulfovibrionales bacterium]
MKLTPLRISIIYAVVGGLWILFSDNLLAFLLRDVPTLMKFSLLKGWLYVVVTAWMLYLLIRRYEIERRRREDFSRSQEQRYQNLVETERDVIYSLSTDGSITSLNPSFEKTTGFRSADLIGENFARLVHPD